MAVRTPHQVLLHPYVSEKTLNMMERENSLMFIVREDASKDQVKWAFENLYDVKVERVNVRHSRFGKQAIIRLTKDYSAGDIGMRMGVF
jgi:large subunit ribosomal protein L23